ncbi:hypothetical protein ACIA8H_12830 [Streptomyces goshikiensis]|uniref:hypothetical protein n=1 Tax=Streptomyces goshikiensis TaxID=1942 RepID=UPI0037B33F98
MTESFLKPGTPPAPGFARFWQMSGGPRAVLCGEGRPYGYNERIEWADHSYRFRAAGGSCIWMAEPYERHPYEDAYERDKAALEAAGYDVRIDQAEARYNPGRTLPIVITRRNGFYPAA